METQNENAEHEVKITDYQCPMKCEADKVYNQPGDCPVCHMKLMPANVEISQSNPHHCC